jgi:hypothetical protein
VIDGGPSNHPVREWRMTSGSPGPGAKRSKSGDGQFIDESSSGAGVRRRSARKTNCEK